MKRLITTTILCAAITLVKAQTTVTTRTDTIIKGHTMTVKVQTTITDTTKKTSHHYNSIHIMMNHHHDRPSVDSLNRVRYSGFKFQLSGFGDFSLGLATLIDNGGFNLSPKNQFLNYTTLKTSYVGFNILNFGYRFNNHFKIDLAAGFDWTLIRLQNDSISIVPDKPTLTYRNDGIRYSKNRFSSNYLVLPLSFGYRSNLDQHRSRFHLEAGPEVGFLVDGMLKQISAEHGKTKNFNDFHFNKFEYGAFTRIGYGHIGLFTKYYFNDMFANSPNQQGLKSFSFGFTFGFD